MESSSLVIDSCVPPDPVPLGRQRKNRNSREFREVQEKIRDAGNNSTNTFDTNSLDFYTDSTTTASSSGNSVVILSRMSRSRSNSSGYQCSTSELEREFRQGNIDEDASESIYRWSILRSVSIFNERPDLISQQLKAAIHFEIVMAGQQAQKQGAPIEKIYWILQGSFVVQQECDFVTDANGVLKQYKRSGDYVLSSNEVITRLPIEAQSLSAGDWFSYIPPFPSNATESEVVDLCLKEKSDCSITSQEESNVAWIYIKDLINCTSLQAIAQLNRNPIFRFNLEFLEEELMQQNQSAERRKNCAVTDSDSLLG